MMNLKGRTVGISTNFITKKFELTVSVNEADRLAGGYETLKDAEVLDIRIARHRRRRSLDANAYFHVLVDRLADALGISKPRCKNILLGRYGQPLLIDGEGTAEAVIKTNIPASRMLESETVHCMPCGQKHEDGKELVYYKIFRGSSTYDSREMSILIDGAVSECRDFGIETLPPDELERMVGSWKA